MCLSHFAPELVCPQRCAARMACEQRILYNKRQVSTANGKRFVSLRGQLFVCQGCCCGNTEAGNPAVPLDRFKKEWKQRNIGPKFTSRFSGCLGPCTVPNIVLLNFRGETVWFHSINDNDDVVQIYDYLERLLERNQFELPKGKLADKVFQRVCQRFDLQDQRSIRILKFVLETTIAANEYPGQRVEASVGTGRAVFPPPNRRHRIRSGGRSSRPADRSATRSATRGAPSRCSRRSGPHRIQSFTDWSHTVSATIDEQHNVHCDAGTETRTYGEMHPTPQSASLPFLLESHQWDFRLASFDISAATTLADEELPLDDARRFEFTVFSHNDVKMPVPLHPACLKSCLRL